MSESGEWVPQPIPVVLPRELDEFVRDRVADGTFGSPSDLIAEALFWFRDQVALNETKHAELKAAVQIGIDEADRGELVDGPTFMAALRARLAARAGQTT